MDTSGKQYLVGNITGDSRDSNSNRQVRAKDATHVTVATRDQEDNDSDKFLLTTDPAYDPKNPGAVPNFIKFLSNKYKDTPAYLGENSGVANLKTSVTTFALEVIDSEPNTYYLSLKGHSDKYLTMDDPTDGKNLTFEAKGTTPDKKKKQKWIFVKADPIQW